MESQWTFATQTTFKGETLTLSEESPSPRIRNGRGKIRTTHRETRLLYLLPCLSILMSDPDVTVSRVRFKIEYLKTHSSSWVVEIAQSARCLLGKHKVLSFTGRSHVKGSLGLHRHRDC